MLIQTGRPHAMLTPVALPFNVYLPLPHSLSLFGDERKLGGRSSDGQEGIRRTVKDIMISAIVGWRAELHGEGYWGPGRWFDNT